MKTITKKLSKTVTISSKGQIAIPKDIRQKLEISQGDKFNLEIKNGKIYLEPVMNIPRSQGWFWDKEIQEKVKKSETDYKKGNYKRYENIDDILDDLKDE